jgi:hypothetical protein
LVIRVQVAARPVSMALGAAQDVIADALLLGSGTPSRSRAIGEERSSKQPVRMPCT